MVATAFFTTLNSLWNWQPTYLNVTDTTGQYVTIGVTSVTYSSGVWSVSGGLVVSNGISSFSGTAYANFYVQTSYTGPTGLTGSSGPGSIISTGAPQSNTGSIGQFYYDLDTSLLYGPKISNGEGISIVSGPAANFEFYITDDTNDTNIYQVINGAPYIT